MKTIYNDIVVENNHTWNLLTGIPSKLFLGVFYVGPHPAPGFVAEDLDPVFLNCLSNTFIRCIRLKLFDLRYNAMLPYGHFVISEAASVFWGGKAFGNIATKLAILTEQAFRFRLSHHCRVSFTTPHLQQL